MWLEDHVQAPDTLVESDAFRGALRARGALPLHLATGSPRRDALLIARARSAAREHNVDRAVLVDVNRTSVATRAHVWVVELRHPGALVDSEASLPPAASTIDETRAVLGLLRTSAASSPPADEGAEARALSLPAAPAAAPFASGAASEADRIAPSAGPQGSAPLLSLQAALGVGMRHFSYVDRVTPALRPYDLDAAPLASITATVYPLAFTRVPVVRDLGLSGEYAQAVGIPLPGLDGRPRGHQLADVRCRRCRTDSVDPQRDRARLCWLRGQRLPVRPESGQRDAARRCVPLPACRRRRQLRIPVGVRRVRRRQLSRHPRNGRHGAGLPERSVGGVEAHLGLSFALSPHWQASIGAAYTRFFYSFNPVPGDASVAGGALDEQTRALAAFAYRL